MRQSSVTKRDITARVFITGAEKNVRAGVGQKLCQTGKAKQRQRIRSCVVMRVPMVRGVALPTFMYVAVRAGGTEASLACNGAI